MVNEGHLWNLFFQQFDMSEKVFVKVLNASWKLITFFEIQIFHTSFMT